MRSAFYAFITLQSDSYINTDSRFKVFYVNLTRLVCSAIACEFDTFIVAYMYELIEDETFYKTIDVFKYIVRIQALA